LEICNELPVGRKRTHLWLG